MRELKTVSVTLIIREKKSADGEVTVATSPVACCNLDSAEDDIDPIFIAEGMLGALIGVLARASVHDKEATQQHIRRLIVEGVDSNLDRIVQDKVAYLEKVH